MKDGWIKAALVLFGLGALAALVVTQPRRKAAPPFDALLCEVPPNSNAARACVQKFGAHSVPLLLDEVKKENRLRSDIVTAMTTLGPAAVPPLVTAFADTSSVVRLAAVRTFLSLSGDVEREAALAAPALLKLTRDPNPEVRYVAALAWRRLGTQRIRSVPVMIDALHGNPFAFDDDESLCLRMVAAQSLGQLGPEAADAVPELRRVLDDAPTAVCKEALVALWRITHDTAWFNAELSRHLTAPDLRTRLAAAVAVRRLSREAPLSGCVREAADLIGKQDAPQALDDGT